MQAIRIASLLFVITATVGLTIRAAIHDPTEYTIGVGALGCAAVMAICELILRGKNK